jgi:hypothetical protein
MPVSTIQALKDGLKWSRVIVQYGSIYPITTPENDKEDHSPIGFSGWDRHSACHGSVALSTLAPKPKSSYAADQGTLAHAIAARWLIEGKAPKGADMEMENNVRPYVYAVWDRLPKQKHSSAIFMVEGRVAAPKIHPDCRGTVDTMIWDDHEKVLQIHDLKYGKRPVDVKGNVQLLGYAMCAIAQWPQIEPKRIDLYIHQVRLQKIPKLWSCAPMDVELFEDDVREHVAAIEKQKRILAKTKDPKKLDLHAGDHCVYCPAKSICHVFEDEAKNEGLSMLMPKPDALSPDAGRRIALAVKFLPYARALLEDARAHLNKGGEIPGVFLAKGPRVRVAKGSDEDLAEALTTEVEFGGLGLPTQDIMTEPKPPVLKTIPQLEKIVPKDKQDEFSKLWAWQDGAPVLALEGSKKEPHKIRPEDYFKPVKELEDDSEDF